jgi:acetylornithine/succinyldiaminopimelate/putrescine aminotransferase
MHPLVPPLASVATPELFSRFVVPNYGRYPVTIARGDGAWVWDEDGRRYLDFATGIAVCPLGHRDPAILRTIREQSERLLHCSNLYWNRPQGLLARFLVERMVEAPGKVFFCNSGAEANETLIKLARKFGASRPGPDGPRFEVLTFEGSFHGRTMAGISATAQAKVKTGFSPLLEGFRHLPWNDLSALEAAVRPETAAVLLEPVQGEGGIRPVTPEFLLGARRLCRDRDLLLMFDEVQCGIGRLGTFAGWKSVPGAEDLVPDAVSWAKGMGGGLPVGAVWISDRATGEGSPPLCDVLGPGSHGSTFGGGPFVAAVALTVLEEIERRGLIARARELGPRIADTIRSWNLPAVQEVRGLGLMLGVVLAPEMAREGQTPASRLVAAAMERGLLLVPAGSEVVRLLPPLSVSDSETDEALGILRAALISLDAAPSAP